MKNRDEPRPIGLILHGWRFASAAITLANAQEEKEFGSDPTRFLFTHAIELMLKSFLRMHGVEDKELRSRDLGHSISRLLDRAIQYGLRDDIIGEGDADILDDAILDRYRRTGMRTIHQLDGLYAMCVGLYDEVAPQVYLSEGFRRAPDKLPELLARRPAP